MIKIEQLNKEQIKNQESMSSFAIYTNDELVLFEEIKNKLRESYISSYKSYQKYVKNVNKILKPLGAKVCSYNTFSLTYSYYQKGSYHFSIDACFKNISVDKYIASYMKDHLLYFYNIKTYYCPKCHRLQSLSGVHEKLECCGIDKVVVNLSTKSNDTAILTKTEQYLEITNNDTTNLTLKTKLKLERAEVIVEGKDIYKVIKTTKNKFISNGSDIIKNGEVIGFSQDKLRKDDMFVIVNDKIEKVYYPDEFLQIDENIINCYKRQNPTMNLNRIYRNLYNVLQAWEITKEITPQNIVALSLIYEHNILGNVSHSIVLSRKIFTMGLQDRQRLEDKKIKNRYVKEELNVLINVINSLLQNNDTEDILTKINNNNVIKEVCLKHKTEIDNIINKKVLFQTEEVKQYFYTTLTEEYCEDIETLSFIFSKITKSHRLQNEEEIDCFISSLKMCKIVDNKILFQKYLHCNFKWEGHLYFEENSDAMNDMSKILNLPYFYNESIFKQNVLLVNGDCHLYQVSDKLVSKLIKNNIEKLLIPVYDKSRLYYTSWFSSEVLEELLSEHTYLFDEYNVPFGFKTEYTKDELFEILNVLQSMKFQDVLSLFTYCQHVDSRDLHYFALKHKEGKLPIKTLKSLFVKNLKLTFLKDFEKLKKECEDLFPELVGRTINYDRIVMEHDYYMQRRREGTVDMTSIFNDRYVKFKSFKMNVEECKYIVEAPREVKDLIHEGVTQNHCMDSYGKNIESGQEMVLFVRLKRGEPLYAVSLDIDGNVVQSSGESHSAVPGEILAQIQREFANDKAKMESIEHFFNCRN